jgi:hypothetical protein
MARLPKRTSTGTSGTGSFKPSGRPTYGVGRKGRPFHSLRNLNIATSLAKKAGRKGPTRFKMPKFGTHRRPL